MLSISGKSPGVQLATIVGCEPRKIPGMILDQCLTDYVDGNSGVYKSHPCRNCLCGSRRRAEFSGDSDLGNDQPPPTKSLRARKTTPNVEKKKIPDQPPQDVRSPTVQDIYEQPWFRDLWGDDFCRNLFDELGGKKRKRR